MHKIVFLDRATLSPRVSLRQPLFPHTLDEHQQTGPDEVLERLAGRHDRHRQQGPAPGRGAGEAPRPEADRGGGHRHRLRRQGLLPSPRHRGRQHPRLRAAHGTRAYLRADAGAAAKHRPLSRGHAGRRVAALRPVLLLQPPDPRPRRGSARDHRRGRARASGWPRSARPSACSRCSPRTRARAGSGPLYTPWEEVLETSDIITMHSPLTPETPT